jgi:hypothetical protein
MTKRRYGLIFVAMTAALYGLASVLGGAFVKDIEVAYRVSSIATGLLLVGGAWLLWRRRPSGALLLWASAALYLLVQLLPGFRHHGMGIFSVLIDAFYISAAVRIGLAVAAHYLIKERRG